MQPLSNELLKPLKSSIEDNLKDDEIFSLKVRVSYLGMVPLSILASSVDILFGLVVAIKASIILGDSYDYATKAVNHLRSSRMIFTRPYIYFLKFINPHVTNEDSDAISYKGNGFLSDFAIKFIISRIAYQSALKSDYFFTREIKTRLSFGLLAMVLSISRIADGAISIPACAFSICTAGAFPSINNLAYRTSQAAGGIIFDSVLCGLLFLAPQNFKVFSWTSVEYLSQLANFTAISNDTTET